METGKVEMRKNQTIPHDIVFDILTRLPVKSLFRFRCVSKLWNSTISNRCFVKSHQNHHFTGLDGTGTTLIITFFEKNADFPALLYTIDHRDNKDPVAVHHHTLSGFLRTRHSHNGLICLKIDAELRICNPSTREFITLPITKLEATRSRPWFCRWSTNLLGYDPINNQHKVLNTWVYLSKYKIELTSRVFVLGVSSSWRRIRDGPQHYPCSNSNSNGVCVNGIIFYKAWTSEADFPNGCKSLFAFDVRLETFRLVEQPDIDSQLFSDSALIRFDGHLAIVDYLRLNNVNTMDIWVWVLEDQFRSSWIHKRISLSPAWTDIREDHKFYLAGTVHTGEIILATHSLNIMPLNLFYLDLKSGSARRVQVSGLPDYELSGEVVHIFATDHMENILSLTDLS